MEQVNLKTDECSRPVCYVRMSPIEYKRLQTMMKTTGLSAPELFRRALFARMNLERPLFSPDEAKTFGTELKRQGNNINQIATKINSGLMNGWSQALAGINRGYVMLNERLAVNYASR
jgi:hypothetical protein